jgi:hypothetical protein
MSTVALTSGNVMDQVSSLLNDTAKTQFTYTVQLPYLNTALEEFQNEYELNEVPVTDNFTSNPITIPANNTGIGFATTPALPPNLVTPTVLWERTTGIDPYVQMSALQNLPLYMEGAQIPQLIWYTWQGNMLNWLPANGSNDIKIEYVGQLFLPFKDINGNDLIAVINAQNYLAFRTAALCARYIGENPTRADSLDQFATHSMDQSIGQATKGRQNIMVRRMPFRHGWKRRVYM